MIKDVELFNITTIEDILSLLYFINLWENYKRTLPKVSEIKKKVN